MSASRMPTFSWRCASTASMGGDQALCPRRPLPLHTPITFLICDSSCGLASRLSGSVRLPQLWLQVEQSCVHSLMLIPLFFVVRSRPQDGPQKRADHARRLTMSLSSGCLPTPAILSPQRSRGTNTFCASLRLTASGNGRRDLANMALALRMPVTPASRRRGRTDSGWRFRRARVRARPQHGRGGLRVGARGDHRLFGRKPLHSGDQALAHAAALPVNHQKPHAAPPFAPGRSGPWVGSAGRYPPHS